jgi:ribonuclease Z
MSGRELVVLGTASQVPTKERNHNGYLLRWDDEGLLFDPGEGTQRQMLLAGVSARSVTRIFVTHFHGDHSLGLPGVLQRLNLDGCPHPVRIYFPAVDERFYERLRDASHYDRRIELAPRPVSGTHWVEDEPGGLRVEARPLEHGVPTYGYRISEPGGVRFLPERLAELGLRGPAVGELARAGSVEWQGHTLRLENVAEPRRGMAFAFVMDTRPCAAAEELARDVDLLVMESTFLESEAAEARAYRHSTARETAALAAASGARHLLLAHFSQRYEDPQAFLDEARGLHGRVSAARDLERVPIPWGRRAGDA